MSILFFYLYIILMTKQLSIYECINVLKYYNKDIPKSIYKIKQKQMFY